MVVGGWVKVVMSSGRSILLAPASPVARLANQGEVGYNIYPCSISRLDPVDTRLKVGTQELSDARLLIERNPWFASFLNSSRVLVFGAIHTS